ncbi:MAG: transporter substrate-binding domain-containing protein [Desulfuromonadaceae bacterium]|nr:transporter substrate-binding domain-containing protein [Desulfuromonadaceae bacterium]MDD2853989.1 transporter substrate-binding domain-containing protein [Desulfuromonadaceae bacterium]
MKRLKSVVSVLLLTCMFSSAAFATELDDVKKSGVLRHVGIPYANFVSGTGDGMEVELTMLFAKSLGVKYEFVQSDWGVIVQDVIGRKVKVAAGKAEILEEAPVKGDIIANGFTIIPWRKQVVEFATPTFPNQIWLIARSDSPVKPIKPTHNIEKDIQLTKALMKGKSVLSMEKTCLDPALYKLSETGAKVICRTGNLNEMAPAVLNNEGDFTILDVPDALIALEKWKGKLKIIGPVSGKQQMAAAFPKDAPKLLAAYNAFIKKAQHDGTYLKLIKKYYPTATGYFPEFFKGMK